MLILTVAFSSSIFLRDLNEILANLRKTGSKFLVAVLILLKAIAKLLTDY